MPLAAVVALAQPPHAVVVPVTTTPWKTVTVRPGDTLWDLAIAHHTTVAALVEKNHLSQGGSIIRIGQRLLVPGSAATPARPKSAGSGPASTPAASSRVYVVRAGDTMYGIAATFHVSLTKLLAANRLKNAELIFVGQRINVPVTPSAAKPATTAPGVPPAGYTMSPRMAKAIAASKARLADERVPTRAQTAAMIRVTATRHGVDPKLALAIGWLESGWYQRAVSYTDAVGVMQIMPTSSTWASELAGRTLDRYDTQDNITGGVLILRALQAVATNRDEAIAGYYQGLASVRRNGQYADTKQYVALVKAIYARM